MAMERLQVSIRPELWDLYNRALYDWQSLHSWKYWKEQWLKIVMLNNEKVKQILKFSRLQSQNCRDVKGTETCTKLEQWTKVKLSAILLTDKALCRLK